jgi:WD40 repeat protein
LPLADRVVEVIAVLGEPAHPTYRYGSGCVVAGRTVLTAAHVVKGAVSVKVRDRDKVVHEAALDLRFVGDVSGPGPDLAPDLALVEITGPWIDVPAMGLAAVDRESVSGDPVERCHAVGYPAFMERKTAGGDPFRETADAFGHLPVLAGLALGLLSVEVSSAPCELPPEQTKLGESQWSGMSGGPVVADGLLLGVVTEHARRAGPSAIMATPLTALDADPAHPIWGRGMANSAAWWARMGVSGRRALPRMPAPRRRIEPTYWATVREIHQRTGMLVGRQDELAEIASFATGAEDYRRLVADAYGGKTSLLAEAVALLRDKCDVVCYFLSRREGDADSSLFLAAVVPQLAYLLEEDQPTADLHQFRAFWQRAAERAAADNRHLLLIVDGLDEDRRPPGLLSVAAVLPVQAGDHAHVLVSIRSNTELPDDMPPGHPLVHTQPVLMEPFPGAKDQAALARQEIDNLMGRDETGLTGDVFGLLTAAAGPLTVEDLATMTVVAPQSAVLSQRIRRLLTVDAARSLQQAGSAGGYQFAHGSLLEYALTAKDLTNPEFRRRIHDWAQTWRDAGWPLAKNSEGGTPKYLLESYPGTLADDPQQLAALVSDTGWVDAAIQSVGADHVTADLRRAAAADPAHPLVRAMLATVVGQAPNLRPSQPLSQPGYVLRQLCLQAAELSEDRLAGHFRARLRSRPGPGIMPRSTTRHVNRALSGALSSPNGDVRAVAVLPDGHVVTGGEDCRVLVWDPGSGPVELGRHDRRVLSVAVLPDGRVVSVGEDCRVLVWDPARPGSGPVELGRHERQVRAVAVLPDGHVVTGGEDCRVLVWDLARPGSGPVELGRQERQVRAVAALPDGRVASGGADRRVLVWDPAQPGSGPVELGRHDRWVSAVAALPDGRVASGGADGRVLVWNPAQPGSGPVELGRNIGEVSAVAVLPDGRVVSGGEDCRVLVWDLAQPGSGPVELGCHGSGVRAVAALPGEHVVSGGADWRVLVWNSARPGSGPVELGRHDRRVLSVAVLPDGRAVSGGADGRVLVWDSARPGSGPVELGRHEGHVRAVTVLPDGRVVSGGADGRVLVWDPARPGSGPVELGRHDNWVRAVAVLPDGRIVSGGEDCRVLIWDPARPGSSPVEFGRHDSWVSAVAVLPGGRVVSGGADRRVLVWDPMTRTELAQLNCSVNALATGTLSPGEVFLVVAHQDTGFSIWSVSGQEVTASAFNQPSVSPGARYEA